MNTSVRHRQSENIHVVHTSMLTQSSVTEIMHTYIVYIVKHDIKINEKSACH